MAAEDPSDIDPYGFERAEDFDGKAYEDFMSRYLSVLARRAGRWENLVGGSNKATAIAKSSKLKRYIRKGIPREHRPMVWMCMSGAEERRQKNPGLYQKLLHESHDKELIDTIKIDIGRTFPDNIFFQDQQADPVVQRNALYNVLVAVAHNNKRIGYCQGLNFIAGMLLLVMREEDKVFWMMDTLLNVILQDYYAKDMLGVKVDCEVLGQLIKIKVPAVYNLADQCGCAWSIVATKWFICLFADVIPVEVNSFNPNYALERRTHSTLLRIWDSMFYEGDKILFRVGVTLVKKHSEEIMKCRSFPEVMDVFKGMTKDKLIINCHEFMEAVFSEPGSFPRSLIEKLRKECKERIEKEGL